MKKLVFATNNQHKTEEIRLALVGEYEVLNLNDIGCNADIPETANTFEGNASLKSKYVVENFNLDCFADDSGLEVAALNNEPGVFSARYGGSRDSLENMQLVLQKLEGQHNRKARFKTVISLMLNDVNHIFEGTIEGTITQNLAGSNGFGYDPIFQPDGYDVTFAEMDMAEKNKISHRAIALKKMIEFLKAS
ncbi:non-canonical purine NTP pyrophosphatase [Pedobacter sp. Leaf41]|jgi:XTP/dITP diphosphohydrolase|uniref:non-canonical purine NTP diphosphatase n=1 Tax=Pedobacter sp. Leaf41 TaxID=1736218 RepID=UPI000702B9AB|nr:non-canonical purine NTP diphosphatase [Pedobacter sp. Leaf41]KQN38290.1 non-canonical purine NTP pyrophosphatase [Pedobacter sp. Leaf41]RZL34276.1 MAG: non-canonical purine NTP diphosphatase [Pedobacter sp.]